MNLEIISALIAERIPEMSLDSATNNAEIIKGMLRAEINLAREKCNACGIVWSPSLIESGTCIFCILREKNLEIDRLRTAIAETLRDNAHLADGDNCTLISLKRAMPNADEFPRRLRATTGRN